MLGGPGSLSSPDMSLSSEGVLWAERVQEEPDRVLTEVLAPLPRPRLAGLPTPRPPATRTASSSAQQREIHVEIHVDIQYPSDTRYKAFCVSNAFIANAKRVYYKHKTRLAFAINAFAENALCETRLD